MRKSLSLVLVLLTVASCKGKGGQSASNSLAQSSKKVAQTVSNFIIGSAYADDSGLPTCDGSYDGKLALIISNNSFKLCQSGSWVAVNLKGEKGDKGDKGDTGNTGAQGIQGIQGVAGAQGIQGIQGPKGDKGDQGDAGSNGSGGMNYIMLRSLRHSGTPNYSYSDTYVLPENKTVTIPAFLTVESGIFRGQSLSLRFGNVTCTYNASNSGTYSASTSVANLNNFYAIEFTQLQLFRFYACTDPSLNATSNRTIAMLAGEEIYLGVPPTSELVLSMSSVVAMIKAE